MKYLLVLLSILSLALPAAAVANDKIYKQVDDNKIFFSAFNSTFIDPDVAVANKIVRGKDKGLVNIAVVMGSGTGKSALISGKVYNIFQMSQTLEFVRSAGTGCGLLPGPFRI